MKYCIYCGRPLEENEQCSCQEALAQQKGNQTGSETNVHSEVNASNTATMDQSQSNASQPIAMDPSQENTSQAAAMAQSQENTSQSDAMTQSQDSAFRNATMNQVESNASQANSTYQSGFAPSNEQPNFQQNGPQGFQQNFSQETQNNQNPPKHTPKLITALKNIGPFLGSYFKAPTSTIRMAVDSVDVPLAIIFLVLYGLSIAAFVLSGFHYVKSVTNQLLGVISLYLGSIGSIKVHSLVVLDFCLLAAIFSILFVILLFVVMNLILNSKRTFKQILVAASTTFVYPILSLLLCIIFLLIYYPIALCLLPFVTVSHLIMLFVTAKACFQAKDDSRFTLGMIVGIFLMTTIGSIVIARIGVSFAPHMISMNAASYNNEYYNYYNQDNGSNYYGDDDSSDDSYDDFYNYYFGN